MKVIWKGSIELVTGIEKITLEAPAGTEDDLHSLKKAAKRGEELELRVANKQEVKSDDLPDFIRSLWTRYAQDMKDAREEGKDIGFTQGLLSDERQQILSAVKPEVIHESPERQADVIRSAKQIQDNQPIMTQFPDMNRDGLD
jgi:hypothetical protein